MIKQSTMKIVEMLGAKGTGQRIEDLGLDSLDFLQVMVDLEAEFKIQIGAEEMAACDTVGELVDLIEGKC